MTNHTDWGTHIRMTRDRLVAPPRHDAFKPGFPWKVEPPTKTGTEPYTPIIDDEGGRTLMDDPCDDVSAMISRPRLDFKLFRYFTRVQMGTESLFINRDREIVWRDDEKHMQIVLVYLP